MSSTQQLRPLKFAIFVGGSGTRLWPMSRKRLPKQFQTIVGQKTMFQQMIDHLLSGFDADDLFISTSKDYATKVLEQAPMLNPDHIITEPELRDTTAAVGYAAVHIAHRCPNAMMATIWGGDHLVRHRQAFIKSLKLANRLAQEQKVTVQINVRPTAPSTSLGYVEIGEPIYRQYAQDIYAYVRQVEKPNAATARQFLASVRYLWHSGYRVWDLQTLFSLYQQHVPEAYTALMNIKEAIGTSQETEVVADNYAKIIKKSIDYTIFEHLNADGQAVIAADLGWNDIGTWNVLHDELAVQPDSNVTQGENVLLDTSGSVVYGSKDKLVAVVGMHDMVIVDTPDALLIIPKDRASSEVKKIIEELKERGLERYL